MRTSQRLYLIAALLLIYAVAAIITRPMLPDMLSTIALPTAIIAAGISGVLINRGMNADR
ncbi:MAG: hypothetical protein Q4P05_07750 [Actinomycetaceae bacterium]|nr:hypothetical protein [Actinomycetaceae bacterium]